MFRLRWQKIVMLVMGIAILLRVISIIGGFYNIDRKEYTYFEKNGATVGVVPAINIVQKYVATHDRLQSIQIILANIPDDKIGNIELKIYDAEKSIYEGTLQLAKLENNAPYNVYLNIPMTIGKEYKIYLNADELCFSAPLLYFSDSPEYAPEGAGFCCIDGEDTNGFIFMRYSYLEPISTAEKGMKILGFLAIYLLIGVLVENYKKCSLVILLEMGIGLFYIECKGITLDLISKLFFITISFISGWNIREKYLFCVQYLETVSSKIVFWVITLMISFSLQGYSLFISPEYSGITWEQVTKFIIIFIWTIPIVITIFYYYEMLSKKVRSKAGKMRTSFFIIIATIMLTVPFVITLIAFNPGITTIDTHCCLAEMAHSIRNSVDWHPIFYCLILKAIISVWDSTYAVLIVQFIFWLGVMLEGFLLLRKKGWQDSFLLITIFLIGINISNNVIICSIWKDIPYATAIMWLTIITAKFIYSDVTKLTYIELIFSMLLVFALRQNGIVPYLIVSGCFILYFKSQKIVLAIAISACLIVGIKGPLYSSLNIIRASEAPSTKSGMYIGLAQDILGVYYFRGNVSENTMEMIKIFTDEAMLDYPYSTGAASLGMVDEEILLSDFIKNYIDTFLHNPLLMTRVILARIEYIWNIYPAPGTLMFIPYTGTVDGFSGSYFHPNNNNSVLPVWNDYYSTRKNNCMTDIMTDFVNYTCTNQFLYVFNWRIGEYFVAALFGLIIIITTKKKKYLLLYTPLAGHILGLVLSTGWSDYRYFWPIGLMSIWILLFLPVLDDKENCLTQSEGQNE